jgi:hypothetical protein
MRKPNRWSLALGAGVLAALVLSLTLPRLFASHGLSAAERKQADTARVAQGTLSQRFALLSQRHTNKCSLASIDLNKIAVRGRLQGSCCSAMVYSHYAEQVRGLRAYATLDEIPADPYDVPVALAKQLIGYKKSIKLTDAEQAIYDQAKKLSDEHGPCCCHCWRWNAFEGQAKGLIDRRQYSAAQIAKVWNLEDGCGGAA